jgi:hypothetical protein
MDIEAREEERVVGPGSIAHLMITRMVLFSIMINPFGCKEHVFCGDKIKPTSIRLNVMGQGCGRAHAPIRGSALSADRN